MFVSASTSTRLVHAEQLTAPSASIGASSTQPGPLAQADKQWEERKMPAKKRRQRSGQQVHTAAAQAKARDQDTIRLINQALADGHVRHFSVFRRTIQDSMSAVCSGTDLRCVLWWVQCSMRICTLHCRIRVPKPDRCQVAGLVRCQDMLCLHICICRTSRSCVSLQQSEALSTQS